MAEWTHRICERCWFDGTDSLPAPGVREEIYHQPIQVIDPEPGACCYCGGMTITGIYTRQDETRLLCRGRHEPDETAEWSMVAAAHRP